MEAISISVEVIIFEPSWLAIGEESIYGVRVSAGLRQPGRIRSIPAFAVASSLTEALEPPYCGGQPMTHQTLEDAARAALNDLGLLPPKSFEPDKFHVVDAEEGRRGNGAGRVKIFADGKGGFAQNWRTGERRSFFLEGGSASKPKPLSKRERARIDRERQRRQAEETAKRDQAACRALSIWQAAAPAPADHPYLVRKQIKPHGARIGRWRRIIERAAGRATLTIENALLLPLHDPSGTLRSLQAIFPAKHPVLNRDKDFLPGSGLAGLFWWIGPRPTQPDATVLIGEGFATCATLHEETGYRVYLAFTAGN